MEINQSSKWVTILPKSWRKVIRRYLQRQFFSETETISEAWDSYAYRHQKAHKAFVLGEEWNEANVIGIQAPNEHIPLFLYDTLFAPFFGHCGTLLEIGSGGGRFTDLLLLCADRLIAADTSPTMLALLQSRMSQEKKINYLQLDGKGLSQIPSNSIDAVFSFDVFVHLQHWDIYNYIQEINRVLKSGGKAIVHHSNTFSELGWRRFLEDLPRSLNCHKSSGSFILMTPDIMLCFAQKAGLKVVKQVTEIVKRDCITMLQKLENSLE